MIRRLKSYIAKRKLQRMVEQRRKSFECEQYRRRRAAALKHFRRPQAT
jgi:hypothetical protein